MTRHKRNTDDQRKPLGERIVTSDSEIPEKIDQPLRVLPDGRGLWIYPMMFGKFRLGVGPIGACGLDDVW